MTWPRLLMAILVAAGLALPHNCRAQDQGDWLLLSVAAGSGLNLVAPSGLSATSSSYEAITVQWTDNSTGEAGYVLERAASCGGPFTPRASFAANAGYFLDTGLTGGQEYCYRVRAYKNTTYSAYSNTDSATAQSLPPAPSAPSNLQATAPAYNRVELTFNDNSTNELGFYLERQDSCSGGWSLVRDLGPHGGTGQTDTTDASVEGGRQYCYRVQAYNAGGDSGYSNTYQVNTPNDPPPRPEGNYQEFWATAVSSTSIHLTWNDYLYEEGYRVYYQPAVGGSGWIHLATVAANGTSLTIIGLSPETMYLFYITAYSGGGESSSWVVNETTPAQALGVLRVVNETPYYLIDVRINGYSQLPAGYQVGPHSYFDIGLEAGTYQLYVESGMWGVDYFQYTVPSATVLDNQTSTYTFQKTALQVLAGEWWGYDPSTSREHKLLINASGAFTRYYKDSGTWQLAAQGTIANVLWPDLSPIISFNLGAAGPRGTCTQPFGELFSYIAEDGGAVLLARQ